MSVKKPTGSAKSHKTHKTFKKFKLIKQYFYFILLKSLEELHGRIFDGNTKH